MGHSSTPERSDAALGQTALAHSVICDKPALRSGGGTVIAWVHRDVQFLVSHGFGAAELVHQLASSGSALVNLQDRGSGMDVHCTAAARTGTAEQRLLELT